MSREWSLGPEFELRCEVKAKEILIIYLIEGTAEIFGIELALNRKYCFHDDNIALFTWSGCKVKTEGNCEAIYISHETPMVNIININAQLEARRDVALANDDRGPRVMIVGPHDSGKSTLARILGAYATRLDRLPILVDLDVGLGMLSVPGCVGAVPLDKNSFDVEGNFELSTPLIYYFGHTNPAENIQLYKHHITNLATKVNLRQENDLNSLSSGLIIKTFGWIDGQGYDLLLDIITLYSVDIVIVIGHDRLYSSLTSLNLPDRDPITVVKLSKSGGTVNRSDSDRRRLRRSKITEYFYGKRSSNDLINSLSTILSSSTALSLQSQIDSLPNHYSPSRIDLSLKNYTLLKPGGIQLPQSMMPIGVTSDKKLTNLSELKLIPCPLTVEMEHTVIGVLHGINTLYSTTPRLPLDNINNEEFLNLLLNANVGGFICVVKVDLEHDILTVLSPRTNEIPSANLFVGSIKWVE
mmetsp:Transcript_909/g.905  ORF Transcript_909/g.905 Transcript_909/m.905 type:complete len:469 (+) Transcript_909:83-1489(+)